MSKAKQTFTLQVELPAYLIRNAAERVAHDLDEYMGDAAEYFDVSTSKVLKALLDSQSFKDAVSAYLSNFMSDCAHDCEWYNLEVEAIVKELFLSEWKAAEARYTEAQQQAKLARAAEAAALKEAARSKRIQIFVPKQTKGFTAELAALLEKYDGKLAEDLV